MVTKAWILYLVLYSTPWSNTVRLLLLPWPLNTIFPESLGDATSIVTLQRGCKMPETYCSTQPAAFLSLPPSQMRKQIIAVSWCYKTPEESEWRTVRSPYPGKESRRRVIWQLTNITNFSLHHMVMFSHDRRSLRSDCLSSRRGRERKIPPTAPEAFVTFCPKIE